MRSALFTFLLLVPALGSAQSITITFPPDNGTETAVGPNNCGSERTASWQLTQQVTPCSELRFWITTGDCGDAPATGDYELDDIAQASWGTVGVGATLRFDVDRLPFFTAAQGAISCRDSAEEKEAFLCARGQVGDSVTGLCDDEDQDATAGKKARILYDSKPPGAPTIGDVAPLDGALSFNVEFAAGTETYVIEYREALGEATGEPEGFAGLDAGVEEGSGEQVANGAWIRTKLLTTEVTNPSIEDLRNEVEYEIRVIAFDDASNESEPSATKRGTPLETRGFWGQCQAAGNCGEQGGCAAAGVLSLFPAGLVVLGLSLRRRQRR